MVAGLPIVTRVVRSTMSVLQAAGVQLAVFVIVSAAYITTMPPDLTWSNFGGDGPELITASYTLGVSHPPGYPLYMVLGKVFSLLPIGTIAFRYHLFSGLTMAVAASLLAGASQIQLQKYRARNWRIAALTVGFTFGFLPLIWGQAIIAEVYALNLAFVATLIYLLFADVSSQSPLQVGVVLGLCISSHSTSMLMIPLAMVKVSAKLWSKLALGVGIGLTPYLLLPILAASGSEVTWGRPNELAGWWDIISANIYRSNVFALPPTTWLQQLLDWGSSRQGATLVFLLVPGLVGVVSMFRNGRDKIEILTSITVLFLFFAFALSYAAADAIVFILPGLALLAVLAGFGFSQFGKLALLLPLLLAFGHINEADLSRDLQARQAALAVFEVAPENAILITSGDESLATIWYYQYIDNLRTDLIVVDNVLFQFDWYREKLSLSHHDLVQLERDDPDAFMNANGNNRPVCRVSLTDLRTFKCYGSVDG